MCTQAVKATIREGKIHQIYGQMQAGAKFGMQTMNQALYNAVINRQVTREEALSRSSDVDELRQMLGVAPATRKVSMAR